MTFMMQFHAGTPIRRMTGAEWLFAAKPKGGKRCASIQSLDGSSSTVALLGKIDWRLVTSRATLGYPPFFSFHLMITLYHKSPVFCWTIVIIMMMNLICLLLLVAAL
jgi:hypothetical protein